MAKTGIDAYIDIKLFTHPKIRASLSVIISDFTHNVLSTNGKLTFGMKRSFKSFGEPRNSQSSNQEDGQNKMWKGKIFHINKVSQISVILRIHFHLTS